MKALKYVVTAIIMMIIGIGILWFPSYGIEEPESYNNIYYHNLEVQYKEVLTTELERRGLENCGITINSKVTPGIGREYDVWIHHYELNNKNEEQRGEFLEEMQRIGFPDTSCGVNYKILL